MAERIRAFDWAATSIGPIATWPPSLVTAVGIMLTTRHPVFIFWGPDLVCLYNDAYTASLGPEKHPSILGIPAEQAWPEAYPLIAPELLQVLSGGEATWHENDLVPIRRHGRIEEVYWTYSYGPIHEPGAPNGVGGVLVFVTETTQAVVRQRASEERYHTLLTSIDQGFCVIEMIFDGEGRAVDYRFIETNDVFERQSGVSDAVGKTARQLVPNLEQRWFDIYGGVARTGEPARFQEGSEAIGRWFDVYALRIGSPDTNQVALLFDDITERRRTEAAIRETEERFRNMADHAPVLMWVTEADGSCTYLNRAWYEFTGQTEEEALGYGWLEATHPEDRPEAERVFLDANARQAPFRVEYRLRRADGAYRWAIDAAAPRFAKDGHFLGYIGSVVDIHDRRMVEERQQLLIHELNHRVKNTLATVQSLASQTLRNASTPADAKEAIEGRLLALSRAHDVLTREQWEGADLYEIVEQAVAPYASRGEDRLHIRGARVRLSPRMALSLAMALQELATNAVKYGALSNEHGEIRIGWLLDHTQDPVRLLLRWEEIGGPPVHTPSRRGFGSRLIERSLASELNGTARIDFAPKGVVCTVDAALE
jgi:PAS domain S-box-containing protein